MTLIARSFAAAALLMAVSLSANAAPVLYELEFDGSGSGDPGNGSFFYDGDAKVLSGFTWDFGSGRTGGTDDSSLLFDVFGKPFAQFLFEVVTGTGPGAGASTLMDDSIVFGFPATHAKFCFGSSNTACEMPVGASSTYRFVDGVETFEGVLTVSSTAIAEPSALALAAGGLAALVFRRRLRVVRARPILTPRDGDPLISA